MFGDGDGGGSTAAQVIILQLLLVASDATAAFRRLVCVTQPSPPLPSVLSLLNNHPLRRFASEGVVL